MLVMILSWKYMSSSSCDFASAGVVSINSSARRGRSGREQQVEPLMLPLLNELVVLVD